MPKVIDCFSFYNELDLLKFRLNYLNDVVDKFVLIEATVTYANNPKPLYYQENTELFGRYKNKIIHVIVDDMPDHPNAWVRENFQRNVFDRGISQLNLNDDDIIIITDLDEIPDRNTIASLKQSGLDNKLYELEMDLYYYNLNCKAKDKWYHSKVVNFYVYKIFNKLCHMIRYNQISYNISTIKKGGWHFSYFGDVNFIKNKIKEFAHQEFNNDFYLDENKLINQIKSNGDLYFRGDMFEYCDIESNSYLPDGYQCLLEYSELYKE